MVFFQPAPVKKMLNFLKTSYLKYYEVSKPGKIGNKKYSRAQMALLHTWRHIGDQINRSIPEQTAKRGDNDNNNGF